jgi:O-antigen/teichoic acid export membrane protein
MNIEDFGEAQSLISLYTQLGVLVGVFGIIVTNLTSNYENIQERDVVISALYKIAYCIIGVIAFAIMISSAFLRDFFQFSSLAPFISLALLLLAGVSFTFRRSFLQGINNFSAMSWAGIIFAAGKVVFSVILVLIGLHSFGAISGLLIAQALSLFYVYLKTRNDFHVYLFKKNNLRQVIKNEYRYAMLILLSTASVTFLYTADVLMVKHWFLPEDAGLYSGIATIARIIFFATVSVSGVLFSAVKIKNSIEENRKILKKGLALTFLVAGTAAAALAIFPSFFIQLLIGSRYLIFSSLLVELSLLIFSV